MVNIRLLRSSDPLRRWQVSTYIHDHNDGPICTATGTPLTPMKSSWRPAGSCISLVHLWLSDCKRKSSKRAKKGNVKRHFSVGGNNLWCQLHPPRSSSHRIVPRSPLPKKWRAMTSPSRDTGESMLHAPLMMGFLFLATSHVADGSSPRASHSGIRQHLLVETD